MILVNPDVFRLRIYEDGRCTLNWRVANRSRKLTHEGQLDVFWYFITGLELRPSSLQQGIALTNYEIPLGSSSDDVAEKSCDDQVVRPFDLNAATRSNVRLWLRLTDYRAL